ncbi:hypothetical protein AB0J63_46065 [Streptosporangium canum]|uniref:hypothetical protein n=1 Tax=Streptosporangium canum TaxID=324952 RepID=UPI003419570C
MSARELGKAFTLADADVDAEGAGVEEQRNSRWRWGIPSQVRQDGAAAFSWS